MDAKLSTVVRGYGLRLVSGQEWHIVGLNRMRQLVDRLASIMRLGACTAGKAPRLILRPWAANGRAKWTPASDLERSIADGLPTQGWKAYYPMIFRVWAHEDVPDTIFEIGEVVNYRHDIPEDELARAKELADLAILRNAVLMVYRQVQRAGALPLHGALAAWNGKGVLLLGHGGAGKSTCCRRLPADWQALSDDEMLVTRSARGDYFAHPFPTWSNLQREEGRRSWDVEQYVPLAAVFVLEKAQTDEVVSVGQARAALFIRESATQVWQACSVNYRDFSGDQEWPPWRQVFDNACTMAQAVPVFILRVSTTGRFWEAIERTLSELPPSVTSEVAVS